MIRFIKAVAVAAAFFMIPAAAGALGVSIVNVSGPGASGTLQPGETVTFDLVIENNAGDDVYGLGVGISGYDLPDTSGVYDNNIRLQGGTVATAALGTILPAPFGYTGALSNELAAPEENWAVNNINPQSYTTALFQGVATNPSNGTGQDDTGIGGTLISDGDVHIQVTFVNDPSGVEVASTDLVFELQAIGLGGALLPASGDSFSLTAVPEPGTALLMGLGLVGLAGRRR